MTKQVVRIQLIVLAAILALTIVACGSGEPQPPASQPSVPEVPVGTDIGQRAPDFTLTDLEGNAISLSDFQGRPVLLNIWSFCVPCKTEKPIIQQAYQKYRDESFEVIAAEMGHSAAEVKEFIAGMGLTFTIALDPDTSLARLYRIRGEPTSFFIDRRGVVQAVYPGPLSLQAIEEQLEPLLKK